MGEFKAPASEKEFEQNFAQIKPHMDDTQAYNESARCLFCYDAPCVTACPTGIDIPLFIKQIQLKNNEGAAKTIYDSNYFGYSCGKICPTEVLCEGACVYNNQDQKPIEIGRLQSFATLKVIEAKKPLFKMGPDNGKKVAVIGAGAAGISCACELRLKGYQVDVFEGKEKPSGLTVYGVAPYKITNKGVLDEMEYLQNTFGFDVHYGKKIQSKEEFSALEKEYEAIFLGIGLGKTRTLKLAGEELENCWGAVEFIEKLRMNHHKTFVGKNVVVLGGGNTAMDAASEAARMGAETSILAYRRGKDSMGAYGFEYELAKQAGVTGRFHLNPVEILGDEKVTGVKFIKTEDKDGKLVNIPGSEFVIDCDMVIKATGQEKQVALLNQISNLDVDAKGRICVDENTFQTSNPKYFAGGDMVNGGAEVVNAAFDGKQAALGIHNCLNPLK